jgi:hypothetical protein
MHLGYEALFIFKQLLVHTSLGLDALCGFDIKKLNGGKQRKQKDTIMPRNNPYVELYRKA